MEEFRKIQKCDTYSVSNLGRIRNDKTGRILENCIDKKGFIKISLYDNKKRFCYYVHQLVAEAFLGDLSLKEGECVQVRFKDGNRINCSVDNLFYFIMKSKLKTSIEI